MYAQIEGKTKEEGGNATEDHAQTEEISQVNPFGNKATAEHEEGVGKEIGRVQKAQVSLRFSLTLSVNLGYPRGAAPIGSIAVLTVQEHVRVLNYRYGFP